MLRKMKQNINAVVDLNVVLVIGVVFAAMTVVGYIIWTLFDQLLPNAPGATTTVTYNNTYESLSNVTTGFDSAVNLILVAITIFILAIAIGALLMLRGRSS